MRQRVMRLLAAIFLIIGAIVAVTATAGASAGSNTTPVPSYSTNANSWD